MSGGVDSSVTAALLKSEGYDVVGITLQLYDHGAATHRKGACCAGQDIHDARNVAERIGIPHYVLDYESRFRESVIDNFADELRVGRDAGALHRVQPLDQVPRSAGDRARTRRRGARDRPLRRLAPPGRRIARAGLRRRRRSRPELFPVRDHARAARLSALSARRHDQAAGARTGAALRPRRSPTSRTARTSASCRPGAIPTSSAGCGPNAVEPGDIVDLDGRVIGRHQGIVHFTVGQRRGLGIASSAPLYVVRLDAASRRVVVGPREALRMDRIQLRDVNWIGDGALDAAVGDGLEMFVRVRSTRAPQPAWLRAADRRL